MKRLKLNIGNVGIVAFSSGVENAHVLPKLEKLESWEGELGQSHVGLKAPKS